MDLKYKRVAELHMLEDFMNQMYEKLRVLERDEKPLESRERLASMKGPLLEWYDANRRILPWREDPEPYRVWISEIMLQQTRVEAVKPYFNRFVEALPTVKALSEVPEEILLKLWEGLGYYNRARNLKKAAILMVEQYHGRLPASYEELLKLPGIGSYTAGAIASIAYGIPVPAVDGNVLRVISRILASREDVLKQSVKRKMEADILEVIPTERASAFNQALIELGAIVCVPNGQPKCGECPLESVCLAKKQGLTDQIPYKAPKKARKIEDRTVLLVELEDKFAILKRPDAGLLASLYEFPNLDGALNGEQVRSYFEREGIKTVELEPLPPAKHIFSHVEWHMTGYHVKLEGRVPESYVMAEKDEIRTRYPLPNAFSAYIKLLFGES